MKTFASLLVLLFSIASGVAHAAPSDSDRATARALAREGYEAQQRGQYAVAAERFERADALVHAPTLLLGLARAEAGLGKLVEAHEAYLRILREGVAPDSPPVFARAVDEARREAAALAPRISWVTLQVLGPAAPHVRLDEAPVPVAALGVRRACNPGSHQVDASAEGFVGVKKTFALGEGGEQTLVLTLVPQPVATAAADAPPAPDEAAGPQGDQAPRAPSPTAPAPLGTKVGIAALAVGALGLLVGGVAGVLALAKHASLSEACPQARCSPGQAGAVGAYHTFADVATAGTIAGGALVLTGATLLVTAPAPAPSTAYAPVLGVSVHGTF